MDLTAIQRKAVFALIVVLLAGLGSYLFATEGGSSTPPAASPPRPHASAAPAVSSPAPASPAPAEAGSSSDPSMQPSKCRFFPQNRLTAASPNAGLLKSFQVVALS